MLLLKVSTFKCLRQFDFQVIRKAYSCLPIQLIHETSIFSNVITLLAFINVLVKKCRNTFLRYLKQLHFWGYSPKSVYICGATHIYINAAFFRHLFRASYGYVFKYPPPTRWWSVDVSSEPRDSWGKYSENAARSCRWQHIHSCNILILIVLHFTESQQIIQVIIINCNPITFSASASDFFFYAKHTCLSQQCIHVFPILAL